MRHFAFALAVAALWLTPAKADDFSYATFSKNIQDLTNQMLAHCRGRASSLLELSTHPDALANPDAFRWACGKALDGRELPHTSYRFAYADQYTVNGGWDVLGVSKALEHNDTNYSLVLGTMTSVATPRSADTSRSTVAVATLFDINQKPIWHFVNLADPQWQRPSLASTQLTADMRAFLDDVWLSEVALGTSRLLDGINDSRNAAFP